MINGLKPYEIQQVDKNEIKKLFETIDAIIREGR
jgi:hypothetical protein